MKLLRTLTISLLVSLAVYLLFMDSAARYVSSGIPCSAENIEKGRVRTMIHGDHLQLLYHYWLMSDFIKDGTPWFHNLYEFNTGKDEDRKVVRSYFVPFSLVYTAGSITGNQALGWNLAVFVSVWLSLYFTWRLVRRFIDDEWLALLAAAMALLLPYRWVCLFGGSPTGFAMLWVPMAWLGIDKAVRDHQPGGGVLAGLAVLFAAFTDAHVFFFTLLGLPVFCVLSALLTQWHWPLYKKDLWEKILALIPCGVLTLCGIAYGLFKKKQFAGSSMSGGRGFSELQLYSPNWREYFSLEGWGHQTLTGNHIYTGVLIFIFLAAGLVALGLQARRKKITAPQLALAALCSLLLIGVLALGWGTEGPGGFRPILVMRKFIPMYEMIRQPAKILCVLPVLVAVLGGLSLAALLGHTTSRLLRVGLPVVLLACMGADYKRLIQPTVSLLVSEQPAYAAVAEACRAEGREPRALAVPLWPGDTAWSSLYEHYAALYRIRMVNGYSPVVRQSYMEDIFNRYGSVNLGELSDQQLDSLLQRGVTHLLFHESAFPEKVSPFPSGVTLNRLQHHPRLEALMQDEDIWAFRILKEARADASDRAAWTWLFPNRIYQAERARLKNAERVRDVPDAGRQGYVALRTREDLIILDKVKSTRLPNLRWMIRMRGKGQAFASTFKGQQVITKKLLFNDSENWQWVEAPLGALTTEGLLSFGLRLHHGELDVDMIVLDAGDPIAMAPGTTLTFPATQFYHRGYSDIEQQAVVLRKDWVPSRLCLYGLRSPLEPGRYELTMDYTSNGAPGTHLANIYTESDGQLLAHRELNDGDPARFDFSVTRELPVQFSLHYEKNADLVITSVTVKRVE